MSDKHSDRDLLMTIKTDVEWMRANHETLDRLHRELHVRVCKIENRQWYQAGVIGSMLIILEGFKDKIFKFFSS